MRIFFVLLLSVAVCSLQAQKPTPILERVVSVQTSNETIASILDHISKQLGISFSYNPTAIHADKKVSLQLKNQPLRSVLNKLFDNTVKYKQSGSILILTLKPPAPPKETATKEVEIIGYVYNQEGERIPKASIYSPTHMLSCVSDAYGYYTLKIPSNRFPVKLRIAKNEYRDTSIVVTSALEDQNIVMYAANRNSVQTIIVPIEPAFQKDTFVSELRVNVAPKDSVVPKTQKKFFEKALFSPNIKTNLQNISDTLFTKVQIGFVPYISTNSLLSGNTVNDYSLNVLIGYSQGINKMELGGLVNIDRGNVQYFQAAGLLNAVGGNMNGIQLAGWGNITKGKSYGVVAGGIFNVGTNMHGMQLAGIANINSSFPTTLKEFRIQQLLNDTVSGIQAAGITNINFGHTKGMSAAGIVNVGNSFDGLQLAGITNANWGMAKGCFAAGIANAFRDSLEGYAIAGIVNTNLKGVHGMQLAGISNANWGMAKGYFAAGIANAFRDSLEGYAIAGIVNTNLKGVRGMQLAGIANIANGTVEGWQISGIVNIAKYVNGNQLALLNFSDSAKGLPIGFLTYVQQGYHKFQVYGDDVLYTQLAWRTGVEKFHNIFTVGVDLTNRFDGLWGFGYGVGSTFGIAPTWSLTTDIIAQQLVNGTLQNAPLASHVFVGIEKRFTKRVAVSFGPTYHALVGFGQQNEYRAIANSIAPYSFYQKTYANGNSLNMWVGAKLAFTFL